MIGATLQNNDDCVINHVYEASVNLIAGNAVKGGL